MCLQTHLNLPSGERHTRERTCKNSSGSVLRQQQGKICAEMLGGIKNAALEDFVNVQNVGVEHSLNYQAIGYQKDSG